MHDEEPKLETSVINLYTVSLSRYSLNFTSILINRVYIYISIKPGFDLTQAL